jgi:hypothetical protein
MVNSNLISIFISFYYLTLISFNPPSFAPHLSSQWMNLYQSMKRLLVPSFDYSSKRFTQLPEMNSIIQSPMILLSLVQSDTYWLISKITPRIIMMIIPDFSPSPPLTWHGFMSPSPQAHLHYMQVPLMSPIIPLHQMETNAKLNVDC